MALLDWIFFGQRLQKSHYIGISIVTIGVLLLGLKDVIMPTEDLSMNKASENAPISIIWPILASLVTIMLFPTPILITKKGSIKHNYSSS